MRPKNWIFLNLEKAFEHFYSSFLGAPFSSWNSSQTSVPNANTACCTIFYMIHWYKQTLFFVWAAQYWDYLPNFMERKSFKSKGRCKKRWTVLRPNIWRNKEIISIKCEHVLKIALPFAMYNTVKWLILLESSLTLNQYMPMPIHMRCCCSSHMPKIVRTMFTFIISLFGFFLFCS